MPILDPDALPLAADSLPQVVQLVLHDVVNRIPRGVDIVAHLLHHVVDGNTLDQIAAAIHSRAIAAANVWCRPARTLGSAAACPAGTLESGDSRQTGAASRVLDERADGAPPRWTAAEKQSNPGPDRCPDKSGGQQVELLLTLLVKLRVWV